MGGVSRHVTSPKAAQSHTRVTSFSAIFRAFGWRMVWRARNVLGSRVISDYLSSESSEGEFVEEEKPWPPPGRTSRPPKRTPHIPRPHSHLFRTSDGRRARGNKHARRWENSMFLSSLHQIPEEELEESATILPSHTSSFTQLFTSDKCMQIWYSFASRSEEEQRHILTPVTKEKVREVKCLEESGEECFRRIDRHVRSMLQHNRHLPLGLLHEAELGLSLPFSIDHRVLVVMLQTSPYYRLLLHGVCQYMGLHSTTEKYGREEAIMVVECRANQFTVPEMTLAEFIEHKR